MLRRFVRHRYCNLECKKLNIKLTFLSILSSLNEFKYFNFTLILKFEVNYTFHKLLGYPKTAFDKDQATVASLIFCGMLKLFAVMQTLL